MLADVHQRVLDRASNQLRIVKIDPLRKYKDPITFGPVTVIVQHGKFYDQGGREMDPADVDVRIREHVAMHPLTVSMDDTPDVVTTCELCGESMNQSQYPGHLIERHVQRTEASAAPPREPSDRPRRGRPPKSRPSEAA